MWHVCGNVCGHNHRPRAWNPLLFPGTGPWTLGYNPELLGVTLLRITLKRTTRSYHFLNQEQGQGQPLRSVLILGNSHLNVTGQHPATVEPSWFPLSASLQAEGTYTLSMSGDEARKSLAIAGPRASKDTTVQ